MEIEESLVSEKAKKLESLVGGTFPANLLKLVSSSREIPANKDFHFFYNFDEFKRPTDEIVRNSQSVLETIGGSAHVWGKLMRFEGDVDGDEAYDWLVNVNDEILERFDDSIGKFERIRKREEGTGSPLGSDNSENGFQLVSVKKRNTNTMGDGSEVDVKGSERGTELSKQDKEKVSFHLATIKKPQDEFNILVNNSNQPFEHVWLEKSEETQRYIHPLEKLSLMDFVDKNVREMKPVKPLPLEGTPFKLIEEVEDLKDLAAKLRSVEEFAVDLEHNQYRSFHGLTCLIQISTRTEDFVIDTFKLWVNIGPYLREAFKDPKKKKVMHGADRDIIWLQRDFGIYVCNLFDTGQASRVLKLERNSLEFLLKHYCGVTANKQYQNADWRIRPLPDVMIRYAREDTHYLLYIYDLMRLDLEKMEREGEQSDSPLIEVYRRSYDVCTQLYEKDLLTGNSYLHVYGLQAASLHAVQLAIVAGLYEWRDAIARADDESTGYVLPNKTLFDIAKEMPINVGKLRRVLKSKLPYVERNIDSVIIVIRKSMQNAAAFESAVQSLKEWRPGTNFGKNRKPIIEETDAKDVASPRLKKCLQVESDIRDISINSANNDESSGLGKVSADIAKKPNSSLGALKRKFESDNKLQTKKEIKLEDIRSPISQPFTNKVSKSKLDNVGAASVSKQDEAIIVLDDESDSDEESSETDNPPDRVITETPCEEPVTQNEKVSGSGSKTVDVIVLDDDDSDDESSTSTSGSRNSEAMGEKQKRFVSGRPAFLNKMFHKETRR